MRPVEPEGLNLIEANADSLYLFNRFYRQNGHKGKARPEHKTWGLTLDSELVTVVRLEPFPWGILLRGLWVHKQHRGKGLGGQLLNLLQQELSSAPCFCLPYSDLIDFYRRHGFEETIQNTPESLLQQWRRYLARGENLKVMQYRPPGTSFEGSSI